MMMKASKLSSGSQDKLKARKTEKKRSEKVGYSPTSGSNKANAKDQKTKDRKLEDKTKKLERVKKKGTASPLHKASNHRKHDDSHSKVLLDQKQRPKDVRKLPESSNVSQSNTEAKAKKVVSKLSSGSQDKLKAKKTEKKRSEKVGYSPTSGSNKADTKVQKTKDRKLEDKTKKLERVKKKGTASPLHKASNHRKHDDSHSKVLLDQKQRPKDVRKLPESSNVSQSNSETSAKMASRLSSGSQDKLKAKKTEKTRSENYSTTSGSNKSDVKDKKKDRKLEVKTKEMGWKNKHGTSSPLHKASNHRKHDNSHSKVLLDQKQRPKDVRKLPESSNVSQSNTEAKAKKVASKLNSGSQDKLKAKKTEKKRSEKVGYSPTSGSNKTDTKDQKTKDRKLEDKINELSRENKRGTSSPLHKVAKHRKHNLEKKKRLKLRLILKLLLSV